MKTTRRAFLTAAPLALTVPVAASTPQADPAGLLCQIRELLYALPHERLKAYVALGSGPTALAAIHAPPGVPHWIVATIGSFQVMATADDKWCEAHPWGRDDGPAPMLALADVVREVGGHRPCVWLGFDSAEALNFLAGLGAEVVPWGRGEHFASIVVRGVRFVALHRSGAAGR